MVEEAICVDGMEICFYGSDCGVVVDLCGHNFFYLYTVPQSQDCRHSVACDTVLPAILVDSGLNVRGRNVRESNC